MSPDENSTDFLRVSDEVVRVLRLEEFREDGDHNLKILKITDANLNSAVDLIKGESFRRHFNTSSHLFIVIISVEELLEKEEELVEISESMRSDWLPTKPTMIQWESANSDHRLLYYNKSGDNFTKMELQTVTEEELIEELTVEGSCDLRLLLSAFSCDLGGSFRGDLLGVSFDVNREFDQWRLIDYATRDDDDQSLRFLNLVRWDLRAVNECGQRVLEIAAKWAGPKSFAALFDHAFEPSTNRMSEEHKRLMRLVDLDGNTPLITLIGEGRCDSLRYLIEAEFDIIQCERIKGKIVEPVQFAWDNGKYDKVLVLLEGDAPFPEGFDQNISEELKELTRKRTNFHENIISDDLRAIKQFLLENPKCKYVYNLDNQSALIAALRSHKFVICAFLESKKFTTGDHGEITAVINTLNFQQQLDLREAKRKQFEREDDAHINFLLSKRKWYGEENPQHSLIARELLETLNKIPTISTILKVVEQAEAIEIVFDFERDSVAGLDPTKSASTSGACDYKTGHLYIAAKDPTSSLGTLAHELCHLAMQIVFDNDCNPYGISDREAKSDFDEIVRRYKNRDDVDQIVSRVFTSYPHSKDWPSELIVRVPHLLAHYREDGAKLEEIRSKTEDLFEFYDRFIGEKFEQFVRDPSRIKARHKLKDLNDNLGQFQSMKDSRLVVEDANLEFDFDGILIISGHLPPMVKSELFQAVLRSDDDPRHRFIFTAAEHFKNDRRAERIYDSFQSPIKPILIVDCFDDYRQFEFYLWETIENFSEKRRIVFLSDTDVRDSIKNKYNKYKILEIGRDYDWSDLTDQSRSILLEETIDFQGYPIVLNRLLDSDDDDQMIIPLSEILQGKKVKIGESPPTSYGYDRRYYINRNFHTHVNLIADILIDVTSKKFLDFLTFTREEFRSVCEQYPRFNVHLIERTGEELIWRRSQGSLNQLRRYVDTTKKTSYPHENLKDLFDIADGIKIMIISDTAGMGKTTVLTHISRMIKTIRDDLWVIKFDLSANTDKLEDYTKKRMTPVQFLYEKILWESQPAPYEKDLFTRHYTSGKVVLMFDSFDEISPHYKEIVIELLRHFKNTSLRQLWVTTRPHLKENLEDELLEFSYSLEAFTSDDQIEFLVKFWSVSLDVPPNKMDTYGRSLINKLTESINDKDHFTGVPLQTRMLAEAFEDDLVEFDQSNASQPNLPNKLNLLEVYERFLDRKYLIYVSEKNNPMKLNVATKDLIAILKGGTNLRKIHQQLALEVLFRNEKKIILSSLKEHKLPPEQLNRIGIVQYTGSKPRFIHRTFAEYYVADFIVYQLSKDVIHCAEVQDFLLDEIFLSRENQVIRSFIDGFLGASDPLDVILKRYGDRIRDLWERQRLDDSPLKRHVRLVQRDKEPQWKHSAKDEVRILKANVPLNELKGFEERIHRFWESGKDEDADNIGGSVLHRNLQESNGNILEFLMDALRRSGHLDTLKDLLLYRNKDGQTIWYATFVRGDLETSEKLLQFVQMLQLTPKESNNFFLAPDKNQRTTWHWTAWNHNREILMKLWRLIQDKGELFTLRDEYGRSIFHWLALYGTSDYLQYLRALSEDIQIEFNRTLLETNDLVGRSVLHYATHNDHQILEQIWNSAKIAGATNKELFYRLDDSHLTVWHTTVESDDVATLRKLCELNEDLPLRDLILTESNTLGSSWQTALVRGGPEMLQFLWDLSGTAGIDRKTDLILNKNKKHLNILHRIVTNPHSTSLDKVWEFTRSVLNGEEIRSLFLQETLYGQTGWHYAVRNNDKDRLGTIWSWIASSGFTKDELKTILVARDKYGQTSWHWSVSNGYPGILRKLWDLYRGIDPENAPDPVVLLAGTEDGRTALYWAAEFSMLNSIRTYWNLIRDVNPEQKKDLLLRKDQFGQTIWHKLAWAGNEEAMSTVLEYGKEVRVTSKMIFYSLKTEKALALGL